MKKGNLAIVLHAHLPYVHHPEHEFFFEENWFFEAVTECYVPLIDMLDRLLVDRVDYRLTLSLSPTLMTLLQDELLQTRYLNHMSRLLALADKEVERTREQPAYQKLAVFYRKRFVDVLQTYRTRYQGDLLAAFKKHQASGRLELMTSAATHGFLPLLNNNKTAVRCQVDTGIETFRDYFGFSPYGFWLPECGYYPGLEQVLKKAGVGYFFVDSHGILDASGSPHHGVYAPLDCGNGVFAFGRDPQSSRQVWSAGEGYPGDPDYREYYSDIGFELDSEAIAAYIPNGQTRAGTGIKYHRVTGPGAEKQVYCPEAAAAKAKQQAADFIQQRLRHTAELSETMDKPPLIVAPYDAELFGHWWYEGPLWLEQVLRLAADTDSEIGLQSCKEYLAHHPLQQQATPSASSWGENGYSSYWINDENEWIYPLLHKAADDMEKLANDLHGLYLSDLQKRVLNQAVRSVLLAQASDWPFIMKSGTTVEYANKRIGDHIARFNYLHDSIRKNRIDERYLTALEIMDDIFPFIDYRSYQTAGD